MKIPASELVLNNQGEVYHLGLHPKDIANKIILVGDQGRVNQIAAYLDIIEMQKQHREFHTVTGKYKGIPVSIISTGIGTDNIDIVLNELDALVNIDLETREVKQTLTQLQILRIGTCGIFQNDIPVHSFILSTGSFGLDNIAHFYQREKRVVEEKLVAEFCAKISLPPNIIPYFASASSDLVAVFPQHPSLYRGYTVTSSGFYAPQGRTLRIGLAREEMKGSFENVQLNNVPLLNFEMESSALFALSTEMGHSAGCICLGIANRVNNTFSENYKPAMEDLIRYALDSFVTN